MSVERAGHVQTVRGLVDPAALGTVMTHEHVLIDLCCLLEPAPASLGPGFGERPLTPDVRADAVHHPQTNADDLLLDDEATACDEVSRYRVAGGRTLMDTTVPGIGRDATALRRISENTDVHITMGTGWYIERCHPPEIAAWPAERLADRMVEEIDHGVADTGIRAGHIGEIGCQGPTTRELDVLDAAADAQRRTGAALTIHQVWTPGDAQTLHRLVDHVEQAGGDPRRTILGHMDRTGADPGLQRSLLDRGVTIEYDLFGYEQSHSNWLREPPSDRARILDLVRLVADGHRDRLVVSQDICFKTMTVRHGGWGYAHILRRVVPGMLALGLTTTDIDAILVANPARLLTFASPAGAG